VKKFTAQNIYNARAFGSSFPLSQNKAWLSLAAKIEPRKVDSHSHDLSPSQTMAAVAMF
jgi:hypothetical protein